MLVFGPAAIRDMFPAMKDMISQLVNQWEHYNRARALLQHRLTRNTFNLQFLLSDRKGIPHLLRFIGNTGRLKTTFGNVRPDDDLIIKEKEIKIKKSSRADRTTPGDAARRAP
jgi:hypothetical protein